MRSGLYGIAIRPRSQGLSSSHKREWSKKDTSEYPGQVEGWVLKCTKKAYRFNEKQKAYLDANFAIGQATGKKLDGDIVEREMRRALGPDGVCLFKVSKFHSKISSYFSCRVAKIRQQLPNDADIRASEEADNFARARETVMAVTLSILSPLISTIFVPWPRLDHWSD